MELNSSLAKPWTDVEVWRSLHKFF